MKKGSDDYSKKKRKKNNYGHLREANLCEASPVPREPVLEVGTLEESHESVFTHM